MTGNTILPRRPYKDGVELSVIALGGMTLVGLPQREVDRAVEEALQAGINYFDVAPLYGDGEAETKLGAALASRRERIFLACKTLARDADGAQRELARSLRRLRTDHFDLYQFHAVNSAEDVEGILASGGAARAIHKARQEGKTRFVGFSSHSVSAALDLLERFPADSVLFPVNHVCYGRGNFGPQVVRRASEIGVACIALKSMALTRWRKGEVRSYPNCWYRPIEDRDLARAALQFALSEQVTSLIPPGDLGLFRLALELAPSLGPISALERRDLLRSAREIPPLMWHSQPGHRFDNSKGR